MAKVDEVGSTASRYQLVGRLAAGGMGEIFLARAASIAGLERYCVLKRILHTRETDARFVEMFLDEARLVAQLQHPNIAQVYDIGTLGDSYFFTMEYVHGESLLAIQRRSLELGRPLPVACVLTIVAHAAAGLHHAHERRSHDGRPLGIVHRDVSPSNLMVSYEGNTKIVDFGVAKAAGRALETRSGAIKGKISYLSPEQCRGAPVDRRSDLFSLGIVAWEALTGERLYRRDSELDAMTAIVGEQPARPSALRGDVAPEIDEVVLRLLAKSADDRFHSAGDVVEAIERAATRSGMLLSASAVSRAVRGLFGVRVEPWLASGAPLAPLERSVIASPSGSASGAAIAERDLAALPVLAGSRVDRASRVTRRLIVAIGVVAIVSLFAIWWWNRSAPAAGQPVAPAAPAPVVAPPAAPPRSDPPPPVPVTPPTVVPEDASPAAPVKRKPPARRPVDRRSQPPPYDPFGRPD